MGDTPQQQNRDATPDPPSHDPRENLRESTPTREEMLATVTQLEQQLRIIEEATGVAKDEMRLRADQMRTREAEWLRTGAGTTNVPRLDRGLTQTRHYWNLTVDNEALEYLAEQIAKVAGSEDRRLRIELVSVNEEDKYIGDTPTFFRHSQLPRTIVSITITNIGIHAGPLLCSLLFDAGKRPRAEMTVSGDDIGQTMSFARDIDAFLREREGAWKWASRLLHHTGWFSAVPPFWLPIVLVLVASLVMYSIAHTVLDWVTPSDAQQPWFYIRLIVETGLTMLLSVIVGFRLASLIQALFPPVRFIGRFSDHRANWRSQAIVVLTLIALPTLTSILASAIWQRMSGH